MNTATPNRRLNQLTPFEHGTITDVGGDEITANRLKRLGLCPGRQVQMIRTGSRVIVGVLNTRLGVDADLAAHVTVRMS